MVKKKEKKLQVLQLKRKSPRAPSLRHYRFVTKGILARQNRILKSLIFRVAKQHGKSAFSGRTLLWGRSRGCKRLYRKICFSNQNALRLVLFTTYDPNRSTFISATFDFFSYTFAFMPALESIFSGVLVGCKPVHKLKFYAGFRYSLHFLTAGTLVSLLSLKPSSFAQYSRSCGTFALLLSKTQKFCKIRLPSGNTVFVSVACYATLGALANSLHRACVVGKAGRNRLRGRKPKVRGVAMNPVDNPHGGRTNGGCCWVTPWGKPYLFRKTSKSKLNKQYNSYLQAL